MLRASVFVFECFVFETTRDREGQNEITIRSERVYSFTFCYVCFALTILSAYYVISMKRNLF